MSKLGGGPSVKFSEVIEEHDTPDIGTGSPQESQTEHASKSGAPRSTRLIPEAAGGGMWASDESEESSSEESEDLMLVDGPEDGAFSSMVDSIEVSAKRLKKLAREGLLKREPKFGPRATAALKRERSKGKSRIDTVEEEVTSPAPDGERRVGGAVARKPVSGLDVYTNRAGQMIRAASGTISPGISKD